MKRGFGFRIRRHDEALREIDEEIQGHLEARIAHLTAQGLSPDAARAEALRRFGDVAAGRAALLAQARRHRLRVRIVVALEQSVQDVRYVGRSLLRSPGFSVGMIATLALGLGINAAVFRVADQVLLRAPAGVRDPHRVVRVETTADFGGGPQRATSFSYGDAERILAGGAFEAGAMYAAPRRQADRGREVAVSAVDARYFRLLGVEPVHGRSFLADEARPGTDPRVAVASHAYWERAFGRAPFTGDQTIVLGARTYRVVGVAPPGFSGLELDPTDLWIPLGDGEFGAGSINGVRIPWYHSDMLRAMRVVGRLPSARTGRVAAGRVTGALSAIDEAMSRPRRTAVLRPIVPAGDAARQGDAHVLLRRLSGAALVVMLLAIANAANLLLARGVGRRSEIGVRLAVGAGRGRIVRLLLAESLLLAAAGGGAAALFGGWTYDALRRLVFPDARWVASAVDLRTFIFIALAAVAAGIGAGLAPALQATRRDVIAALREARAQAPAPRRTRAALVVVQTALSLALVVAAALLVLSLVRLQGVRIGFDPQGLLTVSLSGDLRDPRSRNAAELAERLGDVSGVRGVALASIAPFGSTSMMDITVHGAPFAPEAGDDTPHYAGVSDNYFAVMGMRVLEGRGFAPTDVPGSEPVAVVNASMARRFWGSASPFSSCIQADVCARVVGIVENVRDGPGGEAPMRFYLPLPQTSRPGSSAIVRAEPAAVRPAADTARALLRPGQPGRIEVVADRVARMLRPWQTATVLFVSLGAVALGLASIGLYGIMSYLVSARIPELGIRIALGATPADVTAMVLRSGFRLVAIGGVFGLALAALASRLLNSLVFGVSPLEPAAYAAGCVALFIAAAAAMLPPARRAASIDPVSALRAE